MSRTMSKQMKIKNIVDSLGEENGTKLHYKQVNAAVTAAGIALDKEVRVVIKTLVDASRAKSKEAALAPRRPSKAKIVEEVEEAPKPSKKTKAKAKVVEEEDEEDEEDEEEAPKPSKKKTKAAETDVRAIVERVVSGAGSRSKLSQKKAVDLVKEEMDEELFATTEKEIKAILKEMLGKKPEDGKVRKRKDSRSEERRVGK